MFTICGSCHGTGRAYQTTAPCFSCGGTGKHWFANGAHTRGTRSNTSDSGAPFSFAALGRFLSWYALSLGLIMAWGFLSSRVGDGPGKLPVVAAIAMAGLCAALAFHRGIRLFFIVVISAAVAGFRLGPLSSTTGTKVNLADVAPGLGILIAIEIVYCILIRRRRR